MTEREPAATEPSAVNRAAATLAILAFSVSLGTGTLVVPLLALAAGYDAAAVGLLTAVTAISHLVLRLQLPWLLNRIPDRVLTGVACLMIAGSYALLLVTTALPAFIAAQLLQGGARAVFWTSSQTHAVRSGGSSVRTLALVQVISSIGTLIGPAVAGLAATVSLQLALALGTGAGLFAAAASRAMRHLEPFARERKPGRPMIWRRPGVDLACWAGFTAGGWRAMLGSYIPVALEGAGLTPAVIGGLLSLADGAAMATSGMLVRWTRVPARAAMELSVLASCVGLGVLPLVAGSPFLAGAIVAIGGAGSGVLTTLSGAVASDAVEPNERGDAIAATGTFRAVGLLATPVGVAAGLSVVTLPVALIVAAIGLGVPAAASGVRARRAAIAGGAA